ncbi:hypothetical protein [Aquimarina aquimarini]|uniref:hypothetical protein n=1 Tax=Aquimarina aquimarini TaxID=1191734 RepID=UPI001F38F309|nr:hypothetical protein [Aquimarina aquimarini]
MKFINIIMFVIGIISLSSCASFKKSELAENQIYLTNENLNLINGTYKNNESKGSFPLEYFWGSFYKMKEYKSVYELVHKKKVPYFITLKVLNENNLKVEIKVEDIILKSYVIKGKVKNGYFEQNRKMYIIPAIMLNSYHSSKFRIGYLKDNNIITDFKKIEFGTVYIFSPFSDSEKINNLVQKRISE